LELHSHIKDFFGGTEEHMDQLCKLVKIHFPDIQLQSHTFIVVVTPLFLALESLLLLPVAQL
jgi:hypothetical protein